MQTGYQNDLFKQNPLYEKFISKENQKQIQDQVKRRLYNSINPHTNLIVELEDIKRVSNQVFVDSDRSSVGDIYSRIHHQRYGCNDDIILSLNKLTSIKIEKIARQHLNQENKYRGMSVWRAYDVDKTKEDSFSLKLNDKVSSISYEGRY
tara:strand:+ start:83 stop:532 length:450 start_codon:yes stop_codon:yes gene_type:complete